ncbi:MAG TPA: hypothetical protein DIS94_09825 [Bacteroidetes bacterium]|nr:hypothetical protein [Bacteroidota bacterium]
MKILILLFAFVVVSGCSKMEEKKTKSPSDLTGQNNQTQENPHSFDTKTGTGDDKQATELGKQADDAYATYKNEKSEQNKLDAINKNLAAGMYFMYDADLPPRDKYKPALKFFRAVLELDPNNQDAKTNKEKIEEIYEMMGKPIPQ